MELSSATPVVNAVGRIGDVADSVINPLPVAPRKRQRPEELADALDATDTLNESKTESKSLGTMAKHILPAALVGGLGLGTKFGVGSALGGGDVGYSSLAGAGLGALGATGASLWAGAADRATLAHRAAQAKKTLESLSPEMRAKLRDPKIVKMVREFQKARHTPYQLAELAGTVGGLGGGAYGLATGPHTGAPAELFGRPIGLTTGQTEHAGWTGLAGGAAGLAAGGLAGWLWRRHKRNQVLGALKKTAGLPVGRLIGQAFRSMEHPRVVQPLLRQAGSNLASNLGQTTTNAMQGIKAAVPKAQAAVQPYVDRAAGLKPLERFSEAPVKNTINAARFKGVPFVRGVAGAAGAAMTLNEGRRAAEAAYGAYQGAPQELADKTGMPIEAATAARDRLASAAPAGVARSAGWMMEPSAPTRYDQVEADAGSAALRAGLTRGVDQWSHGPDAYTETHPWLRAAGSLTPVGAALTWAKTRGAQLGAKAWSEAQPTAEQIFAPVAQQFSRLNKTTGHWYDKAKEWMQQHGEQAKQLYRDGMTKTNADEMTKQAAQANQPQTNVPRLVAETGGRPKSASNRALMRGQAGSPERFAGGHPVKMAVDLQRLSVAQALKGHESEGKDVKVEPEELKRGIESEMEHTRIPEVAKTIALDHEAETPDKNYYDPEKGLPAMERSLSKEAAAINLGQLERGLLAGSRMSHVRTQLGRTPFSGGAVERTPIIQPKTELIPRGTPGDTPGRTRIFPSPNGGPVNRVPGGPGMAPTVAPPAPLLPSGIADIAAPIAAAGAGVGAGIAAGQVKTQAEILRAENPRDRAEAILYSKHGILGIDKKDYLLLPGGGQDEGETAEQAVCREAIEEADRKLLDLELADHVVVRWPDEGKMRDGKHDGERTRFYLARDGGRCQTRHADREPFGWIAFDDAIQLLDRLIEKDDWAVANNQARRSAVEQARHLAETEGQDD